MAKNRLYTHILVDCSGSMGGSIEATCQGIRDHLKEIASSKELKARVGITRFNSTSTKVLVDNAKLKGNIKINDLVFSCGGMTPLHDAIGRTVSFIDSVPLKKGTRINFVILTDGYENASREYNKDEVKTLLDSKIEKDHWNVIYLGADHDAFKQGGSVGTRTGQTMSFDKSKIGETFVAATRSSMSYGLAGTAAAGLAESAFTDDERKSAEKD